MTIGLIVLASTCLVGMMHWIVPSVGPDSCWRALHGLLAGLALGLIGQLAVSDSKDSVVFVVAASAMGSVSVELIGIAPSFRRSLRSMKVTLADGLAIAITIAHAVSTFSNSFVVFDYALTAYLMASCLFVSALQVQGGP